jgi:hypothetical protein
MADSTKFMTTCARNCEARSYQITVRQQAAKILDLEHDLRISQSNKQVSTVLELASTVVELEKELANSKESVKRNAHRIVERDEEIADLEKERNILLSYYFDANRWFSKHDPNHYISPDAEKSKDLLKAHNLDQQAKGAEEVINQVFGQPETLTSDALDWREELLSRMEQLRNQSKALKD